MTKHQLQAVFTRTERQNASVLSVYLNVDQSQQANLNRAFEIRLRDMILSTRSAIQDPAELERFETASHRVETFVSAYRPRSKSLALFCDTEDGFFWHRELNLPMQSTIRWDRAVFSEPLANSLDQHEQYGVALIDKSHLRLFSIFLGEIEEHVRKELGTERTGHIKSSGSDHLGTTNNLQRIADEHVRANLRRAVMIVDSFINNRHVDRLLLAGTPEVTAEFRNLLPKRVAQRIAGTLKLAIDCTPQQVLAATEPMADVYERHAEIQRVDDVLTAAAKTDKAVIGLEPTLDAVNFGRVWQLLYSDGMAVPGSECSSCQALFGTSSSECPYCKGNVTVVADIIERTVERALRRGADIEVVTGEAAKALDRAGGIGAFLKTRTATAKS